MVLGSAVIALLLGAGSFAWSNAQRTAPPGDYVIHMVDYAYEPNNMVWKVGQKVTVTLINDSQSHPPKPHEWMVGRDANSEDTVFGKVPADGFGTAFFDGVDINIDDGANLLMLMPGNSKLTGKPAMSVLAKGAMNMSQGESFMPVMGPQGRLTISFTVPDKPGVWEFGCFQQSGQHFLNGMRGKVNVVKG